MKIDLGSQVDNNDNIRSVIHNGVLAYSSYLVIFVSIISIIAETIDYHYPPNLVKKILPPWIISQDVLTLR